MEALSPGAKVWEMLPYQLSVEKVELSTQILPPNSKTIIIPLLEEHIASCPTEFASLIPSQVALEILKDKAKFAKYAEQNNLTGFCPKTYQHVFSAKFPCVLKRTNLNAGFGIRVVANALQLKQELEREEFKNQNYILQELIPGSTEYVTHCVCKNGKIFWSCTYQYHLSQKNNIQSPKTIIKIPGDPQKLKIFEKFLKPLSYTGPCNIDYKLNEENELMIFEINPRLGGSLMRPENVCDLKMMLECIIDTAIYSKQKFLIAMREKLFAWKKKDRFEGVRGNMEIEFEESRQ